MHVDVREAEGGVIIVDLEGRLMAGVGCEIFFEVMTELVGSGWNKILLNLTGLSRIDSAGVGELVGGLKLAEEKGSEVRLLLRGGKVRDVLELSQILPLVHFHEKEAEALASFRVADAAAQ